MFPKIMVFESSGLKIIATGAEKGSYLGYVINKGNKHKQKEIGEYSKTWSGSFREVPVDTLTDEEILNILNINEEYLDDLGISHQLNSYQNFDGTVIINDKTVFNLKDALSITSNMNIVTVIFASNSLTFTMIKGYDLLLTDFVDVKRKKKTNCKVI